MTGDTSVLGRVVWKAFLVGIPVKTDPHSQGYTLVWPTARGEVTVHLGPGLAPHSIHVFSVTSNGLVDLDTFTSIMLQLGQWQRAV